jgi:hypothetical protein
MGVREANGYWVQTHYDGALFAAQPERVNISLGWRRFATWHDQCSQKETVKASIENGKSPHENGGDIDCTLGMTKVLIGE